MTDKVIPFATPKPKRPLPPLPVTKPGLTITVTKPTDTEGA